MLDQLIEKYAELHPDQKMLVVLIPIAEDAIPPPDADDEAIEVFTDVVEWTGSKAVRAAVRGLIFGEEEGITGYDG